MNYQFRLARRLARLRAATWMVLSLIPLASCAPGNKLSSPDSPTNVTVQPSSVVIQPRGANQFKAMVPDAAAPAPAVEWTATGGVIDSTGLYQAGSTPGDFLVIARDPVSGAADTSVVTIRVPPNPVTQPCGNEPVGLTPITRQTWAAVPPQAPLRDAQGWSVSSGWNRLSLGNDNLFPAGNPFLTGLFPAGMGGGGGPFHINRKLPVVKTLYQCFWLEVAPGFTNNGNAGTKLAFVYNTYQGTPEGSSAYLNLFSGTRDAGNMGVNTEGPGGFNRNMPTTFQWSSHMGEWHQFEFLMVANTQATADGILHIWVDGVEDTYHPDVKWFRGRGRPNRVRLP